MNKINYKLINFAILILVLYFLYKTSSLWLGIINIIKKILFPFLISFFLSYTLYPLVRYLKKKKINHFFASLLVVISVVLIITIILYYSIPIITKELITFLNNFLIYKENIIKEGIISKLIIYLEPIFNDLIIKLSNFIKHGSIDIISKSISFSSNLVIIIILTVYFLFNMEQIKTIINKYLSKYKFYSVLKDIDFNLNKYLKSLSLILIIEFIEYTALYFLIGHPKFLLLGIFAGIANIIPYFGSLFTNLIALVSALGVSKKIFILSSLIAIFVPIFDNYVIDPKIIKATNNISPIKTIIAITIASSIFGFVGVIIAIPLYIVLEKIIKYFLKNFPNKK